MPTATLTGFVRKFGGAFPPLRPISLPLALFAAPKRLDLIHRVVTWFRAGERAGLASSLGRGQVRGSNRKIHPQKGTGRARAGDARAPHRRGGGACFGPLPRDFAQSLPLKLRWLAFRSALSARYAEGKVAVIDPSTLELAEAKTRQLAELLQGFVRSGKARKMLILGTDSADSPMLRNFSLAARTLDGAQVDYLCVVADPSIRHKVKEHQRHPVCAYHLLKYEHVCITPDAIDYFKEIHSKLSKTVLE
jgi:50S ribosomal protein L4